MLILFLLDITILSRKTQRISDSLFSRPTIRSLWHRYLCRLRQSTRVPHPGGTLPPLHLLRHGTQVQDWNGNLLNILELVRHLWVTRVRRDSPCLWSRLWPFVCRVPDGVPSVTYLPSINDKNNIMTYNNNNKQQQFPSPPKIRMIKKKKNSFP